MRIRLADVFQAIHDLNETGGSSARKIVSRLRETEAGSGVDLRNLTVQVRRALNQAAETGIVQQRAGRFRINTRDLDPFKDCEECRRRKRRHKDKKKREKGRKKHRRRKKHHARLGLKSLRGEPGDSDDTDGDEDEPFPVRELRRRRRKGKGKDGKGKKKRRRRKKHMDVVQSGASSHSNESNTSMAEDMQEDTVYPDDLQEGDGPTNSEEMGGNQCDNPDCLCNVKEETQDDRNL